MIRSGLRTAFIALAFVSLVCAQEDPPSFRSDSQLVLTGFHVTAARQYVTGLHAPARLRTARLMASRGEITVFESGGQRSTPVEIVLLFDTSGSVTGNDLLDEKLFRENLLAGLPGVTLSVYRFGGGALRQQRGADDFRDGRSRASAQRVSGRGEEDVGRGDIRSRQAGKGFADL